MWEGITLAGDPWPNDNVLKANTAEGTIGKKDGDCVTGYFQFFGSGESGQLLFWLTCFITLYQL